MLLDNIHAWFLNLADLHQELFFLLRISQSHLTLIIKLCPLSFALLVDRICLKSTYLFYDKIVNQRLASKIMRSFEKRTRAKWRWNTKDWAQVQLFFLNFYFLVFKTLCKLLTDIVSFPKKELKFVAKILT